MNRTRSLRTPALLLLAVLPLAAIALPSASPARRSLLHVSFEPTRELFADINRAFIDDWRARTGESVDIHQSHAGSGKQTRAITDGLRAEVASLALAFDADRLHESRSLVPKDWRSRLPHNASPYRSTIVLLVRAGNPKSIHDWQDLERPGIQVITANPKASGGARWNYLALWGAAHKRLNADTAAVEAHVVRVLRNVPVLDTGARGATNTFALRGIGDVLISWEVEALLVKSLMPRQQFEIIYPSVSIDAELPLVVVEPVANAQGTRDLADAYARFLYSEPAQRLMAKHHFRPRSSLADPALTARFPHITLFSIDDAFSGWAAAHAAHFATGGTFDRLYHAAQSSPRR